MKPMPTDVENAWSAGIVDGEGWISVFKNRVVRKDGTSNYRLQVGVSNTDPRMCRKLQSLYGGSMSAEKNSKKYGRAKPYYSWHLHGAQCKGFLDAVLPYLLVKRDQAEVALCYIDTIGKRGWGKVSQTTDDTLAVRSEMYASLRALKAEVRI